MLRPILLVASFTWLVSACDGPECDARYVPPAAFPSALGASLDETLTSRLDAANAPGATLTVRIPAFGTWASAAGVRSIESNEPMAPLDRFRVGSITKAFTAATVLALENEGQLSIGASASDWVSYGLPEGATLARLMNHTAGLFDFTDDVAFLSRLEMPWSPDMVIAWSLDETVSGHGYVFAPGTDWSYSNTNYLVLGRVIETVTGRPFHEAVRARTTDVVGLEDTGLDGFDAPSCGYVRGHLATVLDVTDDMEPTWSWAAGGMISNGYDLCEWVTALYLGDVLPPEDREAMLTPDPLSINAGMRAYGYGTRYTLRNGVEVVGHTGSTMGFNAEVFLHLQSGVCVSVLTNDFVGKPSEIAHPAWALLAPYLTP